MAISKQNCTQKHAEGKDRSTVRIHTKVPGEQSCRAGKKLRTAEQIYERVSHQYDPNGQSL